MLFRPRLFIPLYRNYLQILHYSTNDELDFRFRPKYTDEQRFKILHTLNESTVEQLSRYDLSQVRIKKLDSWRVKNGQFNNLSEVLEVDGLGEKVLERLCNSIIAEKQQNEATVVVNKAKIRRQILFPPLSSNVSNKLVNAVGIHLTSTGVSWAKLCCDKNEVNTWNYHDFSSLPKKLLPTETYNLAIQLIGEIPTGEIYVMETTQSMNPPGNKPVPIYTQQVELGSMLLALLNTSPKHNALNAEMDFLANKVYYLRSNLPARLFRTLVGNERVSTMGIVQKLIEKTEALPCTPITISTQMSEEYFGQSPVHKDILGRALLLVITFMDLCVYRNAQSLAAIVPGRQ